MNFSPTNNAINLSLLPPPEIIESLDYEGILANMTADLKNRMPEFDAMVESDPVFKVLEVAAYRELLLRARINEASRAVMVAYAKGSDLDHLGALFGVERLVITPADPGANPPVPAVMESDERLRQRIPFSLEGYSTAGPSGAYKYHALAASTEVKDVAVSSPLPGEVHVAVLSTLGDGTPDEALLGQITDTLTHDDIRPLTDRVIVKPASIKPYQVAAELLFHSGPDKTLVAGQAREALTRYLDEEQTLGNEITQSGIFAALHQTGVKKVILQSPATDIAVAADEAAYCTDINLDIGASYG
ncbi:baseplate J/gp47 family protein [Thalassomonas viridans]|uniref:Baseplate J/gp47 family protein n=1 Tax=Thalassomonas viridans TaxID=137584 RepID=A0AAE9Z273_9GAMM|nr:baseplate J/gp47 family protein [Thalassomonas viridans]WDE04689.1 baseplate J/gp47 family protein [Thalassomonas viridans]